MRALFFTPSMARGGAERILCWLCAGLQARGHRCRLRTLKEKGEGYPDIWPEVKPLQGSLFPRQLGQQIQAELQDFQPTHTLFWQARTMVRLKRYLPLSSPRIVAVRTSRAAYRGHKLHQVLWELQNADAATFVSHGARNSFLPLLPPAARGKLHTIYNGLNLEYARQRSQELRLPPSDKPLLLYVGSLRKVKNLPMLIRSFSLVRSRVPARLLIIGQGSKQKELIRLISRERLEGEVELLGPKENPYPYMAAADLLLLTSWYEGFPNVILEAHALGTPAVAADCPHGPSEIIVEGKTGYLVPVNDHQRMAEAILKMLGRRDREQVRQDCLERAAAFSLEKMVVAYEELFTKLSVVRPALA